jgi:hypothetical protein
MKKLFSLYTEILPNLMVAVAQNYALYRAKCCK